MPAGPRIPILYIEMDGAGVPVVTAETEGPKGRNDEVAHNREVQLSAIFTQTTVDQQGRPVRDEASTTYTGVIETAEEFGRRVYTEAWDRGWSRADKKVVLGDGAVWIWNIADREFPGALQIVDLYHAREHLWVPIITGFAKTPAAPRIPRQFPPISGWAITIWISG